MDSYESIAACAAALNINPSLLKIAKRNGCNAFLTGGRINTYTVVRFLFEMLSTSKAELPEGFSSWMDVLNSERAKREKIKREKEDQTVLDYPTAEAAAADAESFYFGELDRAEMEIAATFNFDAPSFETLKKIFANLRQNSREKFQAVAKPKEI